jgi:hypothetical protein
MLSLVVRTCTYALYGYTWCGWVGALVGLVASLCFN